MQPEAHSTCSTWLLHAQPEEQHAFTLTQATLSPRRPCLRRLLAVLLYPARVARNSQPQRRTSSTSHVQAATHSHRSCNSAQSHMPSSQHALPLYGRSQRRPCLRFLLACKHPARAACAVLHEQPEQQHVTRSRRDAQSLRVQAATLRSCVEPEDPARPGPRGDERRGAPTASGGARPTQARRLRPSAMMALELGGGRRQRTAAVRRAAARMCLIEGAAARRQGDLPHGPPAAEARRAEGCKPRCKDEPPQELGTPAA